MAELGVITWNYWAPSCRVLKGGCSQGVPEDMDLDVGSVDEGMVDQEVVNLDQSLAVVHWIA